MTSKSKTKQSRPNSERLITESQNNGHSTLEGASGKQFFAKVR